MNGGYTATLVPRIGDQLSVFAVKHALARFLDRCVDLDSVIRRRRGRYVLCYHRVISQQKASADHLHEAMWISPETFEAQLRWMKQVGEVVSCERILDLDTPADRPLFALTFDDGWRDNYEVAFPIMQKLGVTATIFLATANVSDDRMFWPEDLVTKTATAIRGGRRSTVEAALPALSGAAAGPFRTDDEVIAWVDAQVEPLKRASQTERQARIAAFFGRAGIPVEPLRGELMNWDHAREMLAQGIRFGSHTHNHLIVTEMDRDEFARELTLSRTKLKQELGVDVDEFCYPNADYRGDEADILRQHGYRYGYRIDDVCFRDYRDPFYVPRLIVYEQLVANPAFFKLRLLGAPF